MKNLGMGHTSPVMTVIKRLPTTSLITELFNMKNLRQVALLYLMFLTGSCSSVHDVSYDYDRQADFTSLRTYYWLAMPEGVKTDYLLLNRIRDAVSAELKAKGLRVTTYKPDFLIAVQAGTEEKQRTYTTYGTYYQVPQRRQYRYEERTLLFEFVDAKSTELIWRGEAKGFFEPNTTPEKLDKFVKEAVQKTLKNFPPTSK